VKKIIVGIVVFCVCTLLVACSNDKQKKEEEERYNLVYKITRARLDEDLDIIDDYIPDIFLSNEQKNRYISKICDLSQKTDKAVGIQNVEYRQVNVRERQDYINRFVQEINISEVFTDDMMKVGIVKFDIVFYDHDGKKKTFKSENLAFEYEGKWSMILIEETE